MVSCAIRGCGQRTGGRERVRLFCIPSVITRECDKTLLFSKSRRAVWLERINQTRRLHNVKELEPADIKPHIKVCSKHFLCGQPSKLFEFKNIDWAPSSNLGVELDNPVAQQEMRIHELSETLKREDELQESTDEGNGLLINQKESEILIGHGVSGVVYYKKVSGFAKVVKRQASEDEDQESDKSKRCNTTSQANWTLWNEETHHEPQVNLEVLDEEYGQWEPTTAFSSSSVQTEADGSGVSFSSVGVQTDLSGISIVDQKEFVNVTKEDVALRVEVLNLKQFVLSEKSLSESNSLVKFYTGLPTFTLLKQVFNLVCTKIQHPQCYALSPFQEFLIVMMRLRLNLLEPDLGYRFGVSLLTVNKIHDKWLQGLSISLEGQIPWPEEDDKMTTQVFIKAFGSGRRVVIIGCFEVVCDKYKQQKTMHFLIGITPQGKVCFISRGVVGCMKSLLEASGILDKLSPRDVLIAEKGLDVARCLEMYQANPKFPIFTKEKMELPCEEDLDGTIINVQTYVEIIISVVKQNFRILQKSVAPELLTTKPGEEGPHINYIVRICCALTNLCPTSGDD